ncbi:DUF2254 domain-containing protein [uncultured Roseovarius sp.]|uniref:DUF2254 domain-containing protein n=1 Tax=uncultured Roseovarius sp. TaxID=293344 RepID=UPI0026379E84|nr:DUF2254 domain-containing protein [uncultured Roseovarius sp.]
MFQSLSVSKTILKLLRFSRRLWVRVSLMALLAVIAPAVAALVAPIIPEGISKRFDPSSVMPILTILASGMLAVSTFSLNVMVSAHRAAAAQATPRAHRILMTDTTTQTVLATFIGAFVYSLSAIILFKSNLIAPGTSVTILGITVIVVVLVILAMLRWIGHLSDLGSMDATLRATEAEARPSLMQTRRTPALGGSPLTDATVLPTQAITVAAPMTGYVQFIDLPSIDTDMKAEAAALYLTTVPGNFVLKGQTIGHATGLSEDAATDLMQHLVIGDLRTFEQDGAYGLLVLSEIASRALSPGINDPGTAVEVIARQQRLLWDWAHTPVNDDPPPYPNIFMQELSADSLIESAFASIARDGADKVEVITFLQSALDALTDGPHVGLAQAARDMKNHAPFQQRD